MGKRQTAAAGRGRGKGRGRGGKAGLLQRSILRNEKLAQAAERKSQLEEEDLKIAEQVVENESDFSDLESDEETQSQNSAEGKTLRTKANEEDHPITDSELQTLEPLVNDTKQKILQALALSQALKKGGTRTPKTRSEKKKILAEKTKAKEEKKNKKGNLSKKEVKQEKKEVKEDVQKEVEMENDAPVAADPEAKQSKKRKEVSTSKKGKSKESTNETVVKKQKSSTKKSRKPKKEFLFPERGVIYLGHIPYGFFEEQIRKFFSQFGDITRLRLARNHKTGKSKHHAFVEFADKEVAPIVAEAMNSYLLFGRKLICNVVLDEEIHGDTFRDNRPELDIKDTQQEARKTHNKPRTRKQQKKRANTLLKKERARKKTLAALGIDYEFDGYKGKITPVGKRRKIE